jgi:hypothetical protein
MPRRLAVMVLIGLILAAGLCILDDDGADTDLCNLTLLIVAAAPLAFCLAVAGRAQPCPVAGYVTPLGDRPSPPPRA